MMNGLPPHARWSGGRGRGHSVYPNLEFWEDRPGRNPGISHVKCDPVSGNFRLHVRSIPSNWNPTVFRNIFSKCGEPKNIYLNPHTNNSSGLTWGFVEFATYQEACNAVQQLNNNVLLGIQVMFAREKEEDVDPVLQLLSSETEENEVKYQPVDSLNDVRPVIKRTVKNENAIATNIPIEDFHKTAFDPETIRRIEEVLVNKVLGIYKEGECSMNKCTTCEGNCSMACSGCVSVFYCSEDCQNRDWTSHSRNCKGASTGKLEETNAFPRGGGDQRQTNGFGSVDSDQRTNRFGDRRNNRDGDKGFRENRDGDRGFRDNRNSDRGFRERDQRVEQNSNGRQDFSQGKKTQFEERRTKMGASRQNEDDRGFHNRVRPNNQKFHNDRGTKHTYTPKVNAEQPDEDWGSAPQDNDVKGSSVTSPGHDFINKEKKFLQNLEMKEEVSTALADTGKEIQSSKEDPSMLAEITPVAADQNVSKTAEIELPQCGQVLEVIIYSPEGKDSYWVQIKNQLKNILATLKLVDEHFKTCKSQFSPVKDGVCGINFENMWYRCQVVSLEPLTVHYIDFGYPEEVQEDRLFELSPELKALPHYAFKIKLAEGTPEPFLGKNENDTLVVKLIEKIDNYWLVQAVDDKVASPVLPKAETAQSKEGAAGKSPQADVSSQPESINERSSTPRTPVQQPFPPMFDSTNFTTLVITYREASEQGDTYYVGSETIWNSVGDMCSYFKSLIDHCEVLTPKHGTKGLAMYLGAWYRAKVVSLTPPLVYFVDFGNIEPLDPEGLRKCPESHKDVPPMVHKIKLAPGTSAKYFNLPDESQIRAKAVSWLPDSSVLVQIEGENYTEAPIKAMEQPSPLTPGPTSTSPSSTTPVPEPGSMSTPSTVTTPVPAPDSMSTPSTVTTPVPAPDSMSTPSTTTVLAPTPGSTSTPSTVTTPVPAPGSPSTPSSSTTTPVPVPGLTTDASPRPMNMDSKSSKDSIMPNQAPSTIDLLKEKWSISFVPNKVDLVKNSLLGQVYCENLPETFKYIVDNEKYQDHLSALEFDPNFRPCVGEVVALRSPSGEWERGRVLTQEGLVAFNDQCGVIRSTHLLKLPESFANIPSMAAVLTLTNEDSDLLNRLVDEVEISFKVVKVKSNRGSTVVHVTNNVLQKTIEGKLRSWNYEPLETPDPLAVGDMVTISKVIDSNTLLVAPANDLEIQQTIQIDCRKTRENFKSTPKEGDYVAFLDKESDGFFRCRIDKVDKDEYEIYSVDNATYHKVKLNDLHPLPSSLCKIPCRITQIELKGIDKVDQTEHAQIYLSHIVEQDKCLKVHTDDSGKSTLTVEGEEDTLNNKLKELLEPKVVPDSDGKLTIFSLDEVAIPLNQQFEFVVTQTEPLYVQLAQNSLKYYRDLHNILQSHCANDNAPYNPCQGELCLALFEGDWYRCRCLKETNTGVSVLMLVDYGNMFNAQTSNIRRIIPELVTMPSIATSCKIHGLPDPVSPALKARLDEILAINEQLLGTFVAENDRCYEVVIDAVKQAIQELQ